MSFSIKSSTVVGIATLLAVLLSMVVSSVVMPVATADAAKLTACVNKKTGEMKIRFGNKAKKKCPKGYRKVTWNDSSTSTLPSVYAADGTRIGSFLGSLPFFFGPGPNFSVLRNGGQYVYGSGDGALIPLGSPDFTDAACSGPAFLGLSSATPVPAGVIARYMKSLAGTTRIVFRTQDASGLLGVPRAWTGDRTSQTVGAAIATYDLNSETGACELDDPAFTGALLGLRSVTLPVPYDFEGPLSVR